MGDTPLLGGCLSFGGVPPLFWGGFSLGDPSFRGSPLFGGVHPSLLGVTPLLGGTSHSEGVTPLLGGVTPLLGGSPLCGAHWGGTPHSLWGSPLFRGVTFFGGSPLLEGAPFLGDPPFLWGGIFTTGGGGWGALPGDVLTCPSLCPPSPSPNWGAAPPAPWPRGGGAPLTHPPPAVCAPPPFPGPGSFWVFLNKNGKMKRINTKSRELGGVG